MASSISCMEVKRKGKKRLLRGTFRLKVSTAVVGGGDEGAISSSVLIPRLPSSIQPRRRRHHHLHPILFLLLPIFFSLAKFSFDFHFL